MLLSILIDRGILLCRSLEGFFSFLLFQEYSLKVYPDLMCGPRTEDLVYVEIVKPSEANF